MKKKISVLIDPLPSVLLNVAPLTELPCYSLRVLSADLDASLGLSTWSHSGVNYRLGGQARLECTYNLSMLLNPLFDESSYYSPCSQYPCLGHKTSQTLLELNNQLQIPTKRKLTSMPRIGKLETRIIAERGLTLQSACRGRGESLWLEMAYLTILCEKS